MVDLHPVVRSGISEVIAMGVIKHRAVVTGAQPGVLVTTAFPGFGF